MPLARIDSFRLDWLRLQCACNKHWRFALAHCAARSLRLGKLKARFPTTNQCFQQTASAMESVQRALSHNQWSQQPFNAGVKCLLIISGPFYVREETIKTYSNVKVSFSILCQMI